VVKLDVASNNNKVEGMLSQFELDLCYYHRLSTCISYVLQKANPHGGQRQIASGLPLLWRVGVGLWHDRWCEGVGHIHEENALKQEVE